eukprot:6054835-Alexandrium_andersonii.AAC.1
MGSGRAKGEGELRCDSLRPGVGRSRCGSPSGCKSQPRGRGASMEVPSPSLSFPPAVLGPARGR